MKTGIYTLIVALIVLVGCSKEQRVVNRLEGKWTVLRGEIENFGEVEPNMVFQFAYCKQRKQDFCDYSVHDFDQDQTINGSYNVSDDGESILVSSMNGWNNTFAEFQIERLGINRVNLVNYDAWAGEYRRLELKRIQ